MFYTFNQNNSGGSFHHDEQRGIGYMVIVEANSKEQAVSRAEDIGLYFGGEGDCPCCGDRWYEPWGDDGTEVPTAYGAPLILDGTGDKQWGIHSYVHYLDGKVLKISGDTEIITIED